MGRLQKDLNFKIVGPLLYGHPQQRIPDSYSHMTHVEVSRNSAAEDSVEHTFACGSSVTVPALDASYFHDMLTQAGFCAMAWSAV